MSQPSQLLRSDLRPDELARISVFNLWLDQTRGSSRNRGIYVHAKAHTYDNSLFVCGSANLNRRSFTCDTELACAVLDPAVVTGHQRQLWAFLFKGDQRPSINLDSDNSGAEFFARFQAARNQGSLLIPDPWEAEPPRLPNTRTRDQEPWTLWTTRYDRLLDPSSLSENVERDVLEANGSTRPARLDDIFDRLEGTFTAAGKWPERVMA